MCLRQDPDVIAIGEMRDLETIETALTAAETGHLVLATLHTPDAMQTIQRIYSVFPAEQQNSISVQLANCLQAIICQRLLPRASGQGVCLATEICIATPADPPTHSRARGSSDSIGTPKRAQVSHADDGRLAAGAYISVRRSPTTSASRTPETNCSFANGLVATQLKNELTVFFDFLLFSPLTLSVDIRNEHR